MNKEKLIEMGLSEEQAKKVMEALDGNYVTKNRFNEVNEDNKALKNTIADRDKQFEELKKTSGDNEALKQQITELQRQNDDSQKAHEAEMNKLKLDNAVGTALAAVGAKNTKAVRSLFDESKLKLNENGEVEGLSEAIKAVQKSDPYLFEEKSPKNNLRGFQPGASAGARSEANVDFSKMTYSEMAAYLAENPDVKVE